MILRCATLVLYISICLSNLIASGPPAANGLIIEGHVTPRISFRPSTTSSCTPGSDLQKKVPRNHENPWSFLPGLDQCYRRIIWKTVKQNERELPERKEEAALLANGEFVKGRRLVLGIWDTPNQNERKRTQKQKEKELNKKKLTQAQPHQVQPYDDEPSSTQHSPTTIPALHLKADSYSIIETIYNSEASLSEKWDESRVRLTTGITNNSALLTLASEAINSQRTFLERCVASGIWADLSLIEEPNICAEAVTYVLQQKSLKYQKVVRRVWCGFLAKIRDPKLRSTVVTHIMSQESKNINSVSSAWRLLLTGDESLVGGHSTIPENIIATMEQQKTLEALDSYAKVWLRSKFL